MRACITKSNALHALAPGTWHTWHLAHLAPAYHHGTRRYTPRELERDTGIKFQWWNTGWVPVAQDSGGNLVMVDLCPDLESGGVVGQVIGWEAAMGPVGPFCRGGLVEYLTGELVDRLRAGAGAGDAEVVWCDDQGGMCERGDL